MMLKHNVRACASDGAKQLLSDHAEAGQYAWLRAFALYREVLKADIYFTS
jgi:hypothetical protein